MLSVILLVAAGFILYHPPLSITIKADGQGQVTERITTSNGDGAVTIAVFGAAIGCAFIAVNGLRLVRFSVGGFAAESGPASKAVQGIKTTEQIEGASEDETRSITESDVTKALSKVPEFSGLDLESNASLYKRSLVFNGIATPSQLEALVTSPDILNTLRSLYIHVLGRPPAEPLDPAGLVAWGPALYRMGLNRDVIREIDMRLRESPEYRKKNHSPGITGLS